MSDEQLKYLLPGLSAGILVLLMLGFTRILDIDLILLLLLLNTVLLLGAVWDQYNRIIRKQREADVLISYLRNATSIYLTVHLLDLEKGEFIEIRSNPVIRTLLAADNLPMVEKLQVIMVKMTAPEYMKAILDFTNLRTLPKRLAGKTTITQEFYGVKSGWCRARFVTIEGENLENPRRVIYAVEEINEEKRKEKLLVEQAEQDLMTGVLNRGTGEKKIGDLLMLGVKGMFCLIDVDDLKKFNDQYGHLAGDAAITCLVNGLRQVFREDDIIMRYGGDEFVVFSPSVTDEKQGRELIERFVQLLSHMEISGTHSKGVSASVGMVFPGKNLISFKELVKLADECVYEGKQNKVEGESACRCINLAE